MRLVLELIVAAAIIVLGWQQPFKERVPWFAETSAKSASHPQPSTHDPRPTATVSGSWMWDPNHKSTLDRPSATPRSH
jgi:hypothetical protein